LKKIERIDKIYQEPKKRKIEKIYKKKITKKKLIIYLSRYQTKEKKKENQKGTKKSIAARYI